MLIPPHRTPRYLDPLANRIIDAFVRNDDVAALRERGDHAGDGAEGLRVDDT